jgi:hypothetical protein
VFEGDTYGHVAIVTDVSQNGVAVIEQNWSVSGTASVPLTIADGQYTVGPRPPGFSVVGWLRTMDDNFNNDFLNPGRWVTTIVPAGVGTVSVRNQELEMTRVSATASSYQGLATRCSVSGDFDVQVDYKLLNWPPQNFYTVRLAAKDLPDGQFGHVGVYRNSYGNENYQFRSQSPIVEGSTSDLSGKLRLTRSSSMVTGWYHNGIQFMPISSALSSSSNTAFVIDFATPSPTSPLNVAIAFDNFKVNAGTVVCPQ